MIEENLTPEEIKTAQKLATNPFLHRLATFPLRFTAAALIGEKDIRGIYMPEVNNGSVTLIDFDNGPIAVTCFHVIEEYRTRRQSNPKTSFQIGSLELDPIRSLIDENAELDLATIDLKNHDLSHINHGGEFGSCFFRPSAWPPNDIVEGDYVTFGGFPGALRKRHSELRFIFPAHSSVCPITSIDDDHFTIQFEKGYWINPSDDTATEDLEVLRRVGGLSGGPVFIHRQLHFEWVGIIQESLDVFDLTRVRRSSLIGTDGCIKANAV